MRYKLLGRSGLRVSELCLGTMTFGEDWEWGADKEASKKILQAYLDAGGNFIDTANLYTNGSSEKYLGKFLEDNRDEVVLATKYTLTTKPNQVLSSGNSRKNMVQSLEKSLKRLKTDYIDLFWVHAWDGMTPVDEVMRGLDDLVRAGKVLYIGISDTPAWVVSQANVMAELRGWTRFVALQIEYSLSERTPERDLLPMARAHEMAVTPWGALAGGVLTGKYSKKNRQESETHRYAETSQSKRLSDRVLTIGDEVVAIAEEIGCAPACVAYNWTRQQKGQIIPIIGARTEKQVKENIAALEYPLADTHLRRLDEVSKISLGFPHEFLGADYVQDMLFSHLRNRVDNHR